MHAASNLAYNTSISDLMASCQKKNFNFHLTDHQIHEKKISKVFCSDHSLFEMTHFYNIIANFDLVFKVATAVTNLFLFTFFFAK